MSNEPYMRVVVNMLLFLELSDDSVIDPDSAVSQGEGIAAVLQELSQSQKHEFRDYVSRRVKLEEEVGGPQTYISFLRSLCDNLGI